ncbi:phosphate-starvation-inducible PsiE family protein [Clostridium sp. ZS2-4]|uniref:phosphate-starvation-inducible PsiE family protein n=1 Tax=Clostridium sp. ZS2-4 TaxID=2987703 RepID=UPI00227CA2BC|nr:phosphate-starvation-inducible PsiE family protein [Clostridium sp. ZS2-4]MCY6356125.1 phosphate-starvation-inducible PsiE family protein [Clostridium sp. ZS2-4]
MNKNSVKNLIFKLSHILEMALAVIILIKILLGIFDLSRVIWTSYISDIANPVAYYEVEALLGHALLLVIGVELVIMLIVHTPESVVDVLLYAIARKLLLVPKDKGMIEVLIGIVAIAGLFAVKKYLFTKKEVLKESNS